MTAAQEKVPAPEPVLREDRLDYTPTARSVSLCRRRAVRLVSECGYPNHVAEVALLVSELATNALLHGSMRGRLFRVHLILTATTLRIEVSDPPGRAAARPARGRGRRLLRARTAHCRPARRPLGRRAALRRQDGLRRTRPAQAGGRGCAPLRRASPGTVPGHGRTDPDQARSDRMGPVRAARRPYRRSADRRGRGSSQGLGSEAGPTAPGRRSEQPAHPRHADGPSRRDSHMSGPIPIWWSGTTAGPHAPTRCWTASGHCWPTVTSGHARHPGHRGRAAGRLRVERPVTAEGGPAHTSHGPT